MSDRPPYPHDCTDCDGASPADGVWLCHAPGLFGDDLATVVPFESEIDALRHAVDHELHVTYVDYGIALVQKEKKR